MEKDSRFKAALHLQPSQADNIHSSYQDLSTELQEQGNFIFRDKEKWSSAELKILHENFESFVTVHKIKDSRSFLFSNDRYTRKKKRSLGFREHMINGLSHRTRCAVVNKLKTELVSIKRGSLSRDEIEELCALQKTCGNHWREIACAMSRDKDILSQKYHRVTAQNELRKKQNFGRWNAKETRDFNVALNSCNINGNRKRHERTKINWKVVSQTVGTRSTLQCKSRYERTVASKQSGRFQYGEWDDNEIERLKYAIGYHDGIHYNKKVLCGFNWMKISNFIGTRSAKQCQFKSYSLLKTKDKKESNQLFEKLSFREQKSHYWDQSCNEKLLVALKEESDEISVDWRRVQYHFKDNYPIHFLRNKWYLLKVSQANYQICNFEKLIDNLCELFSVD